MEAYDISNISGFANVGSMVVFFPSGRPHSRYIIQNRLYLRFASQGTVIFYDSAEASGLSSSLETSSMKYGCRIGMYSLYFFRSAGVCACIISVSWAFPAISRAAAISDRVDKPEPKPVLKIEGLDVDAALQLLGSEKLYWSVLKETQFDWFGHKIIQPFS